MVRSMRLFRGSSRNAPPFYLLQSGNLCNSKEKQSRTDTLPGIIQIEWKSSKRKTPVIKHWKNGASPYFTFSQCFRGSRGDVLLPYFYSIGKEDQDVSYVS